MAAISPSSARDDGPTYTMDKYNEGTQMALVPLHPANPKNLEAKDFPVVLGRTNLASWWWKTCPCEKYCRLHCRPVAQNIRSLSKVMVMVDSKGEVHVVGKNPHLVTIISQERTERTDNVLRVNDILSIGRRDREPWMRLQVVKRPDHASQQANSSRKHHAPNRTTKETISKNKRSTSANSSRNKNNNATTNRRISSPPEWITTTRKRKATSSSRSNTNTNTSSATTIKQQQQQQRMPYGTSPPLDGSEAHAPKPNTNKRRRTFRDPLILKHNSIHHNNNDRQYPISSLGPARATDHIHLLFQDYETSALLVKATQRKLSKKKTTNDEKGNNSRRPLSCNPPRTFLTDKSQLGLLSKNFAAALMGAVSPASTAAVNQDSQQQSPNDKNESQTSKIDHSTIQPENEKLSPLKKSGEDAKCKQITACDSKLEEATMDLEESSSSQKMYRSQQQEASILSLPCPSHSLEPDDDTPAPVKANAGAVAHSANFATAHHQESDVSPSPTDPVTCLGPWRDIVAKEGPSSFRHALASLILAKNETNEEALWLPDLLEDGISK